MRRGAAVLLITACSAAQPASRAGLACEGTVSCGREQLIEADQVLQDAVRRRGVVVAFSEVLLDDSKLLSEGRGVVSGKEQALAGLGAALERHQMTASPSPASSFTAPFGWTLARADVSSDAELGYSFGWMAQGHYAAVWRRQTGGWKLAVFMHKPAERQEVPSPPWFVPFHGERKPGPAAKQSVSAADIAFAALARQIGMHAAFTTYAAQDAVQLARTMVFGRDSIHQLFKDAPLLHWGPLAGDAAGDLGYTIGAFTAGTRRGNYLTIWRLETDGSWRYILDGGVSG
jgi:hypothetical protein